MSKPIIRKTVGILSPLRYPGAKRRLGAYLAKTIELNRLRPKLFVEPFAGSLSVSLQLLEGGFVEKIGIGEIDPLVASFWKVAFNDSEWLKDEIRRIPVTLDQWHEFRKASPRTDRERALVCLFLNRTSFSGILATSAGPIGGQKQTSNYPIDCRFNVAMIERRLDQIARLRKKVSFIANTDWESTLTRVAKIGLDERDVFYYLDPPFYHKANKLYRYYFDDADHQALHDSMMTQNSPWLLSYDAAEEILAKYRGNGNGRRKIGFLYSAASESKRRETEELIISNLPHLPDETRLWRSESEWRGVSRTEGEFNSGGKNSGE